MLEETNSDSYKKLGEKYFLVQRCYFLSFISIVETILALLSPSLGGICSVPMPMAVTLRSFMKRLVVISATSTAVVIDLPLALSVTSEILPADIAVMTAIT